MCESMCSMRRGQTGVISGWPTLTQAVQVVGGGGMSDMLGMR